MIIDKIVTLAHLRYVIFHVLLLDKCPDSHPHAYYDGHYCCASDYEKIYEPQGTKCDGGKIQYDSMCCGSDDYMPCPSGICSNTGKVLQRYPYRFTSLE